MPMFSWMCFDLEDIRNDEYMANTLVKIVFNKALSEVNLQKLYAEVWLKLFNVHPMSQKLAVQMY